MPIHEVQRGDENADPGRNLYEALRKGRRERRSGEEERPRPPRDTAQVTRPERAALRLLHQRILHSARLAFGPGGPPPLPVQLMPLDGDDPDAWAEALWRSLQPLTCRGRAERGEDEAHRLLVGAVTRGTEETLDILADLGVDGEARVWEPLSRVMEALKRRLLTA